MQFLSPYSQREETQTLYLTSLITEEHAGLARTMAGRINMTREGVVPQLLGIVAEKGKYSVTSRRAILGILWQACPHSEAALEAILTVLSDQDESFETRMAALQSAMRCVRITAGDQELLTDVRAGLDAALRAEQANSPMQTELKHVLGVMDGALANRGGVQRAVRKSAEEKKRLERQLAEVETLLRDGELPEAKRAGLQGFRDRLKQLIAGREFSLLVNEPFGDEADRADRLRRVDRLLEQKLPLSVTTKLLQIREKLILEGIERRKDGRAGGEPR